MLINLLIYVINYYICKYLCVRVYVEQEVLTHSGKIEFITTQEGQ